MKPRYFLIVTGVLAVIVGILFIVLQGNVMPVVGVMGAGLIVQILGANFLGFGVLNIFTRNLEDHEGLQAVLLANFTSDLFGFLLASLYGIRSGLSTLGWIATAIYLILTLGFGFFLVYEPRRAMVKKPCPAEPC
jgi:hypothetical protein